MHDAVTKTYVDLNVRSVLIIVIASNTQVEKRPYNSDVTDKRSLNFEVESWNTSHVLLTLLPWQWII